MKKSQHKNLFRIFFYFTIILLLSTFTLRAQSQLNDMPLENSWRSFNLNTTLPEDVIKSLGKPKNDKVTSPKDSLTNGVTGSATAKKTRAILYKKIGGYDSIEFTFADDLLVEMNFLIRQNKLKGLGYDTSNLLPAKNLSDIFKTDFIIFNGLPKNSKITDFEGQKETTVPKVYKQFYSLIGIKKDSVILVSVDNNNIKAGFKAVFDKPTVEVFPGFAQRIQIVSRTIIR